MELINITSENLESFRTIKPDFVWTDHKLIYKKDYSFERKKDYFEILKTFEETKDCILPESELYLNGRPFGYTTVLDTERDRLTKKFIKGQLLYKEKLFIIKEMTRIIKDIHSVGLAHGDLHMDNILYSKQGLKLIDFDYSTLNGITLQKYHDGKVRTDKSALTINMISILCDKSISVETTLVPLFQSLSISEDFKDYLISSVLEKSKIDGIYLDEFFGEINGNVEIQAKRLLRRLK